MLTLWLGLVCPLSCPWQHLIRFFPDLPEELLELLDSLSIVLCSIQHMVCLNTPVLDLLEVIFITAGVLVT